MTDLNSLALEGSPRELFDHLHKKARLLGLEEKDMASLPALCEIQPSKLSSSFFQLLYKSFLITTGVLLLIFVVWCLNWPIQNDQMVAFWLRLHNVPKDEIEKEPCLVDTTDGMVDFFRPPVDCNFCRNVTDFHRLERISQEEFESKYAYSGQPVIITDAMANWTAPDVFNFMFFKEIYSEDSPALQNIESNCQFFPYKTDFKNLGEVFRMSEERAHMKDGSEPWYIGWSNCDFSAGNILRNHYSRPYFLPIASESSRTDWLFMGSPGYGAHMHIDHVHLPSWQAQVTGTKKWVLEPPPECYYECVSRMEVVVKPGEIIVLDTNKWFHSTLNVGKDISITIGSEYD